MTPLMQGNGHQIFQGETEVARAKRMQSLRLIYFTFFLSAVGFSIVISTLWPFLTRIGGTKPFLGFVVAAYSFGQLLASPIFGGWMINAGPKVPLLFSLMLFTGGSVMYCFSCFGRCAAPAVITPGHKISQVHWEGAVATAHSLANPFHDLSAVGRADYAQRAFEQQGLAGNASSFAAAAEPSVGDHWTSAFNVSVNAWFMLGSRALIGFGAGNAAVCRAYVAGATLVEERTQKLAYMSAAQGLGFIIGPALSAVLSKVPGYTIGPATFDYITAPGWASALLGVLNAVLLLIKFSDCTLPETALITDMEKSRDPETGQFKPPENVDGGGGGGGGHKLDLSFDDEDRGGAAPASYGTANSQEVVPSTNINSSILSYDTVAAVSCIFFFFVSFAAFTVFETIITPLTLDEYGGPAGWPRGWSWNDADMYCGILTSHSAPILHPFCTHTPLARRYCGILMTGSGVLSVLAFMGIKAISERVGERASLLGAQLVLGCSFVLFIPFSGPMIVPVSSGSTGCNFVAQPWCGDSHQLNFFQFVAGCCLVALAFPASTLIIYALFSKILGPGPQGVMMGWLTAGGSAARLVGPVYVTSMYNALGPGITFSSVGGLVLLSLVYASCIHGRLRPHLLFRDA